MSELAAVSTFPSADSGLTFLEEGHRYFFNGKPVPNVTTILATAGMVDWSYCSEFARERGGMVHKAIHYALLNDLDEESVHPTIQPYLAAAMKAVADAGGESVAVEHRVYSSVYGFAGTLDHLRRINGKLVLWDWKTGDPVPATGLQLAAYADAYYEETGQRISHRYACRLFPDGRYQLVPFTDRHDIEVFRAALTVAAWRKEQGLIQ